MTIAELIKELKKHDKNLEVFIAHCDRCFKSVKFDIKLLHKTPTEKCIIFEHKDEADHKF